MRPTPLLLALALLVPMVGCTTAPAARGLDVVASFYPLEYLASRIAGDNVTVGSVVKPGTEPHDYEPTTDDVKRIVGARLLLLQGAGFEAWMETVRAQAATTRTAVATEGIDLRANPDEEEAEELPQDPHTWLDPVLFGRMAANVERAMGEAFPQHAPAFRARAQALQADLTRLHDDFARGLASCEIRVIVTAHAAFGYMAARYDFTMISITGLHPEQEPDPRTVQRVAQEARAHNVTIIFFEELVSPRVAEVVAREAGASTRVLSPIEGIPPGDAARGADYMSRMREDLAALREAMRCR